MKKRTKRKKSPAVFDGALGIRFFALGGSSNDAQNSYAVLLRMSRSKSKMA